MKKIEYLIELSKKTTIVQLLQYCNYFELT